MKRWKLLQTDNSGTTILLRSMVGAVFLSEGLQKFLFADKLGTGRFTKIGLPAAEFFGPLVGSFEIICGVLILIGLITRLAAIPLIVIMLAAISLTKLKILTDAGFWSMLHESRTDWAMLLGAVFLLIKGGGRWSIDKLLWKRKSEERR
ncbi:DoxX family protein [Pedobacter sp. SYSU D00535]|uniref:DoxX family protein n=1 Tax=Pedobacter sp. SYSU D00535 TaxID=2810308 RepID=UPI001A967058|nr:DoxX family protein [Pedobacter sp. SYSU D00535]